MSISIVIIYKMCIKNFSQDNKVIKLLILFISFLIIFNYLTIEYICYLESFMMTLGILLSVISSKIIVDKEKYSFIKAGIVLVIAAFCYQGSIVIFPMFLMTYILLFENVSVKDKFISIVKIALLYGFAMFLTILYSNIFS